MSARGRSDLNWRRGFGQIRAAHPDGVLRQAFLVLCTASPSRLFPEIAGRDPLAPVCSDRPTAKRGERRQRPRQCPASCAPLRHGFPAPRTLADLTWPSSKTCRLTMRGEGRYRLLPAPTTIGAAASEE